MKKYLLILALFLLFIFLPRQSFASTIFYDNFDDVNFWNRWELFHASLSCSNWQIKDGMLGNSINDVYSCSTNIIPNDVVWPTLSNTYSVEVEASFVKGTDHNLIIIVNPPTNLGLELHFQSPGDFVMNLPSGSIYNTFVHGSYPNGYTYKIKSIIEKNNVKVYIDGILVRDVTLPDELLPGKIGLRSGTGADPNSETWFDNVEVTSLDNIGTDLNIPLIKQTTEPWGSQIYDTANIWNPLRPTIGDWGCAMTSAVMVLKFHGYNKLPDGQNLDPGTLNDWLKNQVDGYVGGGLVNWLAISRLSKLAKSINEITTFDALEFFRIKGEEKEILKMDLENSIPDILEEPGHFIVAKGINGETFNINDPYFDRLTLDEYSNTFLSMQTFVPSSTDLSYIMLTTDKNNDLVLYNPTNQSVGEQFLQQPLINDSNGDNSGEAYKLFYYPKPENGRYIIFVSSQKTHSYIINIYSYDENANPIIIKHKGNVGPNKNDVVSFTFNKESKDYKNINFQTTIDDIKEGENLQEINGEIADVLIALISNSQKEFDKSQKNMINKLNTFEDMLKKQKDKGVSSEYYEILYLDGEYLKTHFLII